MSVAPVATVSPVFSDEPPTAVILANEPVPAEGGGWISATSSPGGAAGASAVVVEEHAADVESGTRRPIPTRAAAAPAAGGPTADDVEKSCGLTSRRWHQLFALGIGLLEAAFSLNNAIAEDAFKIEDAASFVFSASAVQESVGLAVMLLLSLCRARVGEQDAVMEEFGSPLAILVNGVRQTDRSLTKTGHFGAMCQAAVVAVTGLVLLQKVDARGFVILFYALLVLFCGFCLVTNTVFCAGYFRNLVVVSRLDSALDPDNPAVGLTYALIALPLGVDVAEILFLFLGGQSWNATILALLDVGVTAMVVFPFGYKRFMTAFPEAARRLGLDSGRACDHYYCCCNLETLLYVVFV
ncbi:expressed unknown protein [Ectocarpus siliculosus]|uniref:Uncharacterized protein n=1 Tax=Ectocarpus siliculosus TaxID=2880 RepID=D7FMC0_ECTSI|nr:expressed unknown protein [Ectocarpus siliculosus]|eukprot:CBJ29938.1 expressed unknown protein [Ectocarpus siliculosus]